MGVEGEMETVKAEGLSQVPSHSVVRFQRTPSFQQGHWGDRPNKGHMWFLFNFLSQ